MTRTAALRPRLGFTGLAVLSLVLVMLLLGASPAAAQELTDEQESLARGIENELIAPCCWTQTVAEHDSSASEEIKAGIRTMVAAGSTKAEIVDFYKERYGAQILAAPEKSGFNLLAYVFPAMMVLIALAVIVLMLQRWRNREEQVVPATVEHGPQGPEDLRRRLDDELGRFDS